MNNLSATAAAKIAHKSKLDILNAIKSGDLSASKNARGHWQIDPSELNRVFPYEVLEPNQKPREKPIKTKDQNYENRIEIVRLQTEVDALNREIDRTNMERERERENLSKHIEDMRTAMARITDQREGQGGKRRLFGLLSAKQD